nr:hypothetical protein [Tanacetum cinerariifolium]
PKLKNHGNGNGNGVAQGRDYALGGRDASSDSNVIIGTVAAVQGSVRRFSTRFRWFRKEVSTRYCSSKRFRNKSILEADVAQGDWWIKNITTANDEI